MSPGGLICIYVYKIKSPFREFADEEIRRVVPQMTEGERLDVMEGLTHLGKELSMVNELVEIKQLDALGITSGQYPVQKFIFDFFLKCFWNSQMGFHESVAINYDRYAPAISTKHNLQEIEEWFTCHNLEIVHSYEDEYGITMHGVKPERN